MLLGWQKLISLFRPQHKAASEKEGNLPQPKKHAPGMFFASLCSAGLFDSVGIVK